MSSRATRKGQVARKSKETRLAAKVDLAGRGRIKVATGLPFLDHMIEQVARYGGFDITLRGSGDVHVDAHHLVEDAVDLCGDLDLVAEIRAREKVARSDLALPGRLVGYARVSTEEQGTDPQLDELRVAGCDTVLEEHASGANAQNAPGPWPGDRAGAGAWR